MSSGGGRASLASGLLKGLIVLSCIGSTAFERGISALLDATLGQSVSSRALFEYERVYQWIVSSGDRELVPRHTAVVDLAADGSAKPGLHRICEQRAVVADVLRRVAEARPTAIVLDKFFLPDACDPGDPGTDALRSAMAAITTHTPVVVGRAIETSAIGEDGVEVDTEEILAPALAFPGADPGRLREGVVNIAEDWRRAALVFWARTGEADTEGRPVWGKMHSLALAAALAHENDELSSARLRGMVEEGREPFVSFSPPNALRLVTPEQLRSDPAARERLEGRVVVIGETQPAFDLHDTPFGRVAGFRLQASYVEALIDGRVYHPAPWWVAFGLAAVYGGGILALTQRVRWHRARRLAAVLALTASTFVAAWLAARLFGVYIGPFALGPMGIVGVVAGLAADSAAQHLERFRPPPSTSPAKEETA